MGSSKALQRNPVAFFLPAQGFYSLFRGCFKFRARSPAAVKRSGHARDRLCQRPHSETLGLECVHDRTRCTQHTRGRLERIRETGVFRPDLWNRLEYQRRRRGRRFRLQMTNHLHRCLTDSERTRSWLTSAAQRLRTNPLTLAPLLASSGADRNCRGRIADPHGVCDVKERP